MKITDLPLARFYRYNVPRLRRETDRCSTEEIALRIAMLDSLRLLTDSM